MGAELDQVDAPDDPFAQVGEERAEVHPVLGPVVENEASADGAHLDVHGLHRQAQGGHALAEPREGLGLAPRHVRQHRLALVGRHDLHHGHRLGGLGGGEHHPRLALGAAHGGVPGDLEDEALAGHDVRAVGHTHHVTQPRAPLVGDSNDTDGRERRAPRSLGLRHQPEEGLEDTGAHDCTKRSKRVSRDRRAFAICSMARSVSLMRLRRSSSSPAGKRSARLCSRSRWSR